jgi:hypothetical protein
MAEFADASDGEPDIVEEKESDDEDEASPEEKELPGEEVVISSTHATANDPSPMHPRTQDLLQMFRSKFLMIGDGDGMSSLDAYLQTDDALVCERILAIMKKKGSYREIDSCNSADRLQGEHVLRPSFEETRLFRSPRPVSLTDEGAAVYTYYGACDDNQSYSLQAAGWTPFTCTFLTKGEVIPPGVLNLTAFATQSTAVVQRRSSSSSSSSSSSYTPVGRSAGSSGGPRTEQGPPQLPTNKSWWTDMSSDSSTTLNDIILLWEGGGRQGWKPAAEWSAPEMKAAQEAANAKWPANTFTNLRKYYCVVKHQLRTGKWGPSDTLGKRSHSSVSRMTGLFETVCTAYPVSEDCPNKWETIANRLHKGTISG